MTTEETTEAIAQYEATLRIIDAALDGVQGESRAEKINWLKGAWDSYAACVSVARKRVQNISPEIEAQIPRVCEIEQRIWEQHRDRMPISAVDMLNHAKLSLANEAANDSEAGRRSLYAALEPFADIAGEGSEDFPDDEKVVVTFGRTIHYTLTLGDLRRAREAYNQATAL